MVETRASAAAKVAKPTYEFQGPYFGPICMILGLPAVCYALLGACNERGCVRLSDPVGSWPGFAPNQRFWSPQAILVVLGWVAAITVLHKLLPGSAVEGVPLRAGGRLQYKLNGIRVFWVTVAATLALASSGHGDLLAWPQEHQVELLTASWGLSSLLSAWLYAKSSRAAAAARALGGDTGTHLYDFFIGRELNPRAFGIDLKEFCEIYPGMMGWMQLNVAAVAHAWLRARSDGGTLQGFLGGLGALGGAGGGGLPAWGSGSPPPLSGSPPVVDSWWGSASIALLVTLFQALYVWDALSHEPSLLSTMDITTDGFGWMLAFGDLTWVPFTYSLQARAAASAPRRPLGVSAVAWLCALNIGGYVVFRGSNGVKDLFRRSPGDPRVASLETIDTRRGTRLIVSGWWGMCRHPNYLGDWLMAWAWCLPLAALGSPVPFFYVTYFGALLVHRSMRDDHACRVKYGADWDRYCARVRWVLIPGLY